VIRATITSPSTGKRTLLLGVDRENMNRLMAGQPIYVEGKPLNLGFDVAIVFGESLQNVVEEMQKAGIHFPPSKEPSQ
jgi:hypothetical protein